MIFVYTALDCVDTYTKIVYYVVRRHNGVDILPGKRARLDNKEVQWLQQSQRSHLPILVSLPFAGE